MVRRYRHVIVGGLAVFGAALPAWAQSVSASSVNSPAYERHHAAIEPTEVKISTMAAPKLPDVALVRDDGTRVRFLSDLNDGRPVVLSFIFTTCSTICPTISQSLAQFQEALGPAVKQVHMMSISLDPENDNVARLHEYAQKFSAGPQWQHYTGSLDASVAIQRVFGVYRTDKMNHSPVYFIRPAPGKPWTRLEGFATANDLLNQYHHLTMPAMHS
jgi:protein SCO1